MVSFGIPEWLSFAYTYYESVVNSISRSIADAQQDAFGVTFVESYQVAYVVAVCITFGIAFPFAFGLSELDAKWLAYKQTYGDPVDHAFCFSDEDTDCESLGDSDEDSDEDTVYVT